MGQSIFIDFLQVAISVINVNVIRDLPDLIAQGFDIFHGFTFLCSLRSLRLNSFSSETSNLCVLCFLLTAHRLLLTVIQSSSNSFCQLVSPSSGFWSVL